MGNRVSTTVGNTEDALLYITRGLPINCMNQHSEASCLDRIKLALAEGMARLGYKYVRYSHWLKDPHARTNMLSPHIGNFPPDWEQSYHHESLYLNDPVVRVIQDYASKKHLVYGRWHDAYEWALRHPLGDDERQKKEYRHSIEQVRQLCRDNSIASGYYYSWADNTRHTVLNLASPQARVDHKQDDDFINALHSIVILVNQSVQVMQGCLRCGSLQLAHNDAVILSESELRVLQIYRKERKVTQKQVAAQYGKSVDAVNHHLRSIRRKLNLTGASGHVLASYAAELNLL